MRLNTIKPAPGSRRVRLRVGRGASAGQGKTCGRGVKGQRARKGGYHKVGFEGGQTALDRRLPKVGFRSAIRISRAEVRLSELAKVDGGVVDLEALKKAGVIPVFAERAKVVLSGEIKKALTLKGVGATKGARAAIEAAGGTVEVTPESLEVAKKAEAVRQAHEARRLKAAQRAEAAEKSEKKPEKKAKAEDGEAKPKAEKKPKADKAPAGGGQDKDKG